jgi:GMP synthase (glutamine-hydrolysing)
VTTPVVLVVEHEAACPPAHVGRWLEDAGCSVEVCRPYDGDALPALASYDALVVLGGSVGANDDAQAPWLTPLKQMVREAVAGSVPTLGICLGHQVVAVALGGTAARNPRGQQVGLLEQGWLPDATDDPLLAGSALPRRGVQWNDDIVTDLPEGARLLAATPEGEPQVVRFAPTVWGVQSHPEVDVTVLASWADGDRDDHLEKGIDQAAVLAEIEAAADELEASWRPVLTRFAALTGR